MDSFARDIHSQSFTTSLQHIFDLESNTNHATHSKKLRQPRIYLRHSIYHSSGPAVFPWIFNLFLGLLDYDNTRSYQVDRFKQRSNNSMFLHGCHKHVTICSLHNTHQYILDLRDQHKLSYAAVKRGKVCQTKKEPSIKDLKDL